MITPKTYNKYRLLMLERDRKINLEMYGDRVVIVDGVKVPTSTDVIHPEINDRPIMYLSNKPVRVCYDALRNAFYLSTLYGDPDFMGFTIDYIVGINYLKAQEKK